jgi:hypothetical protein
LEEEEEPAADDVDVTATTTSTTNPEPSTMVATPEAEPTTPIWDLKNCPSLYPRSGNDCVIIDGYDYKKCFYYEYGPDVVCQCSDASPIWICTGTITRNPGVLQEEEEPEEEDLEVTVEVIEEEEVVIIVVEQEDLEVTVELFDEEVIVTVDDIEDDNNSTAMIIEDDNNSTAMISEEEEDDEVEVGIDAEINTALLNEEIQLLCPTDIPLPGDECVLDGFDTISCCYTDPKPIPGTLGTILCTCTDDFGEEEFTCMRGSLSLCTV